MTRPLSSEQWAGTTVSTDPNFSFATIPFTVTKTKMTDGTYYYADLAFVA